MQCPQRTQLAVALDLFIIGLVPSYSSVLFVEKHYTGFWTGFWNIYGIVVTTIGLSLDNYNPWWVWGLFAGGLVLFIIAWIVFSILDPDYGSQVTGAEKYLVSRLGSSWSATSINWGLYFGFVYAWYWGLLAMILHAIGIGVLLLIIGAIRSD